MVADGLSREEILAAYPNLKPEDVHDARAVIIFELASDPRSRGEHRPC